MNSRDFYAAAQMRRHLYGSLLPYLIIYKHLSHNIFFNLILIVLHFQIFLNYFMLLRSVDSHLQSVVTLRSLLTQVNSHFTFTPSLIKETHSIKEHSIFTLHHMYSIHTTDNMTRSTSVIPDIQGKYFEDHLEEHHILSLFNSGVKIGDLLPKYQDLFPAIDLIVIQIGSNNCSTWDNETSILTKIQHFLLQIERKI